MFSLLAFKYRFISLESATTTFSNNAGDRFRSLCMLFWSIGRRRPCFATPTMSCMLLDVPGILTHSPGPKQQAVELDPVLCRWGPRALNRRGVKQAAIVVSPSPPATRAQGGPYANCAYPQYSGLALGQRQAPMNPSTWEEARISVHAEYMYVHYVGPMCTELHVYCIQCIGLYWYGRCTCLD